MREKPKVEDWSDFLNPVMLKELRQDLRSIGFVRVFCGMHLGLVITFLMVLVRVFKNDSEQFYSLYWGIITLCLLQGAGRNAALITFERKANTLDLLLTTGLGPKRILVGKWAASMAFTFLFAISLLPYAVLHYVISGGNIFSDVFVTILLVFVSAPIHSINLVFSSINGFWRRQGFLVIIIGMAGGIIFLSAWGMRFWGFSGNLSELIYWGFCIAIGAPLLTVVTLNLHGSMISGIGLQKARLALITPEYFKVRTKLDWRDWLNPFMVKEIRQRLRSGQYPVLFLLFQGVILLVSFSTMPEFFWIIVSVIFLFLLPIREIAPIERERDENTMEPILFTQIVGKDLVYAAWATSLVEGLLLSILLLPWLVFRGLLGRGDLICDIEILVALNTAYGPLVAFGAGITLEGQVLAYLFLAPCILLVMPAVLVISAISVPTRLMTGFNLFLIDVIMVLASVWMTTSLLRSNWKLKQSVNLRLLRSASKSGVISN